MRTETILREYLRDPSYEAPSFGWERLIWHAADLIRTATIMRNTKHTVKHRSERFYQPELFQKGGDYYGMQEVREEGSSEEGDCDEAVQGQVQEVM